ncbi:hypothetical protein TNCT1_37270 [Streptomyces sp. 1-11]|nr:hypothetical protein TNCT1_37270 [Streptomyces sp. 1-11]
MNTERNKATSAQRCAICSWRRSRKALTTRDADSAASCSGTYILSLPHSPVPPRPAGAGPMARVRRTARVRAADGTTPDGPAAEAAGPVSEGRLPGIRETSPHC